MQAVIMAGGKGTRLSSVIKDIPKPMVPVAGTPLLLHQIRNLKEEGVTDIIIVTGYLGHVIRDYFKDGSQYGVNISYFTEEIPLGTAGALWEIRERLEEDFLLLFGDLFLNVSFRRFLDFHRERGAFLTLFAHPNSHPYDSDRIEADADGRVTGWSAKNTAGGGDYENLVNAGLYVISGKALDHISSMREDSRGRRGAGRAVDLEKELIAGLIPGGYVQAYRSSEYVKDVGTPDRLKKAERDYRKGICEKRNLKNRQKAVFLDRDGTINRYVGFLRDVSQMELEERAAEAIRMLNESEYLAIVVTNQPVLARGECSYAMLKRIHRRMYTLLGEKGAYLDGLYFCPHHPDRGFEGEAAELKTDCGCRKPKTGLIERAADEFHIDVRSSWMIGDTGVDIETGIRAGMKTGLVMTGETDKFCKYKVCPDITGADLLACVEQILGGKE